MSLIRLLSDSGLDFTEKKNWTGVEFIYNLPFWTAFSLLGVWPVTGVQLS